jgi:hypothetical protein
MEIRYEFTDEDALNGLRASSMPSWALFLFVLLLALLFLVGIYLIDHDLPIIGWAWLAASAALGIAVYEVPRIQIRRALRRNPSAQGEIVLLLNDDGVEARFATGKSQLHWRAFTKFKETPHLFVLSTAPYRATFIPKRAMSPPQINELRVLLRKSIPSKVTPNQPT